MDFSSGALHLNAGVGFVERLDRRGKLHVLGDYHAKNNDDGQLQLFICLIPYDESHTCWGGPKLQHKL